ncbi:hypothetical protein PHMEG_00013238 [Phytophthora megakarya]|uniref:Temptin Cys/Cys disulfide domain-containing protein n=1 Tax=Phytophthora megakarya TaxID=4795 RepID=A0A225W7R2_9STRA|nr:hypothetical protein PHMEG_00013238 [Phytophthora megakarya]
MQFTIGLCVLSLTFVQIDGRPSFVARIPNGSGVTGVAALGHVNPSGGGATNAFGRAFQAAGYQWTKALCQSDSDNDGATNGEELGDPCCTWTGFDGASPSSSSPSHPGVPNRFTTTQLASMTCAGEADLAVVASSGATSLSSPASDSQSSSGSFDNVEIPDTPRFSPRPKLERKAPIPVASSANQLKTIVVVYLFSIAVALANVAM